MTTGFELCEHEEILNQCPLCKYSKKKETKLEYFLRTKKYD